MTNFFFLLFKFFGRVFSKLSTISIKASIFFQSHKLKEKVVIDSTKYDMVASPDEPYYADQYWCTISTYLKTMPENANVLDLGCSQGRLAIKAAEFFPSGKVFGCDISEQALAQARKYCAEKKLFNIKFKLQSIRDCLNEQQRESFDVIMMTEVAFFYPEWISDLPLIIASLKKNGILIISFRSQYFNALSLVRHNKWHCIDILLSKREGRLFDDFSNFSWLTSVELENLIAKYSDLKIEEVTGVGACSGISGDPHDFISKPSILTPSERKILMGLELEMGKMVPDAGRYILAVIRKI